MNIDYDPHNARQVQLTLLMQKQEGPEDVNPNGYAQLGFHVEVLSGD